VAEYLFEQRLTLPFVNGRGQRQTHQILQLGRDVTVRSIYELHFREHETSASTDIRQYHSC
jgi:hypothetical protein